ncbi:acyltransferase [Isoptericola sp. NPDC019693]|uniref:acyltransferase n=1 Tax=Isoptericola sp. NPDC019693 TaxID=3364009 RepID=UPI0037A1B9D0
MSETTVKDEIGPNTLHVTCPELRPQVDDVGVQGGTVMAGARQVVKSYDDVPKIRHNDVHLNPGSGGEFVSSSIEFTGTGNVLVIEDGARLRNTRLRFLGNDSVIYLRRSTRYIEIVASLFHESVLYLGPGSSFTSAARIVPSERRHVIIGSDAMFASRVAFRTADPHLVYSAHDHRRVNDSRSVWVGDHVWLGEDSLFLKGARVGSGSILGARAVVTRSVPSNASAGGVPARVIGKDVFWTRPSVHGWTQEQSDRAASYPGDEHIFSVDGDTVDLEELEKRLDQTATGAERAQWCEQLDALKAKNRFTIAH